MAYIKGRWKWNFPEVNTSEDTASGNYNVSFISGGTQYNSITILWEVGLNRISYDDNEIRSEDHFDSELNYAIANPISDKYLVMDFGAEDQEIDDKLYDYITKNAINRDILFNEIDRAAAFNPIAAFPLDGRTYFESLAEAEVAAASAEWVGSTASQYYIGQKLTVFENGEVVHYTVNPDKTLKKLGESLLESGAGLNSIQQTQTGAQALGEASIAIGRKVISKGPGAVAFGESGNSLEELKNHAKYPIDLATATDDEIMQAWDEAHTRRITSVEADSTAAGLFSIALGDNSHVEGESTLANNTGHAEGRRTRATGKRTHAEGTDTAALGNNAHAEGQDSIAKGVAAHAEGYGTVAGTHGSTGGGEGAHSEGTYTKALATASHAEGTSTEARATASHTEGSGTVATREYQHVQGRYNALDENGNAGNYVHIVGWGTSTARKNIHTLDESGNAIFAGDVTSSKASLNTVAKDLATANTRIDTKASELESHIAVKFANNTNKEASGIKALGAITSARYGGAIGWKCQVLNTSSTPTTAGGHGFAIGAGAKAIDAQIALGQANDPTAKYDGSAAIFMIGNGSPADNDEGASTRSNAFAVTASGKGYLGTKRILVDGDVYSKTQVYTQTQTDSKITQQFNEVFTTLQTDGVETDANVKAVNLVLGSTTLNEQTLDKLIQFAATISITNEEVYF